MSDTLNTSSRGISFLGVLFITFMILKLCKVISWSWWWITAPLWGLLGLAVVFAVVVLAVCLIVIIVKAIFGR